MAIAAMGQNYIELGDHRFQSRFSMNHPIIGGPNRETQTHLEGVLI